MIYDHERDGSEPRGRDVADWGGDDLFTSMPRRRAKHASARSRRTTSPATGSHAVRRGTAPDRRQASGTALRDDAEVAGRHAHGAAPAGRVAMPEPLQLPEPASGRRFVRSADGATAERTIGPREVDAASGRRFVRSADGATAERTVGRREVDVAGLPDRAADDAFHRGSSIDAGDRLATDDAGRRTVRITGRPGMAAAPAPRRRPRPTIDERLSYRPDRIAYWAFLLGIILIFIAVATADAASF